MNERSKSAIGPHPSLMTSRARAAQQQRPVNGAHLVKLVVVWIHTTQMPMKVEA
jgi:hypothetical protein